jgi:hypothetical protein
MPIWLVPPNQAHACIIAPSLTGQPTAAVPLRCRFDGRPGVPEIGRLNEPAQLAGQRTISYSSAPIQAWACR